MATAKPSRTRKQPTIKSPSKAEIKRDKRRTSDEKTKAMSEMVYQREYRRTAVALAAQQAKADAMKAAGFKAEPASKPSIKPTTQAKAKKRHTPKR